MSTNLLFFQTKQQILARHPNNGGAPLQLFDSTCLDIRIVINRHSWCFFDSSNEPKEAICFKQHHNKKNLISEIFLVNIARNFFETHNLNIMWLYALQAVTCKVSVDGFSLLYSKLLIAKLSLFIFGAESHWQLLAYVAALFVTSVFRLISLSGWGNSEWDSKSLDCSRLQIGIGLQ